MADLSIQIHPDDDFAKQYNGGRGKPEAWVILDAPEDGQIEFGHHAKNREEFVEWTQNREWDKLLRYLKQKKTDLSTSRQEHYMPLEKVS